MNPKPKRSQMPLPGRAAEDRNLARMDRKLFRDGHGRPSVPLNDQFFHLWQRILVRVGRGLEDGLGEIVPTTLENLSEELAQAQKDGRLPPALVRKLIPR